MADVYFLLSRLGAVCKNTISVLCRKSLHCKIPQQMFGAVVKSYFAEKMNLDPHKIFVVPSCLALPKKAESELSSMKDACGDP